jgi:hypothetical protein
MEPHELVGTGPVIGMQQLLPGRDVIGELVVLVAEHALSVGKQLRLPGHHVPVPDAGPRSSGREGVAILALTERLGTLRRALISRHSAMIVSSASTAALISTGTMLPSARM